jgi:hypothetical protein
MKAMKTTHSMTGFKISMNFGRDNSFHLQKYFQFEHIKLKKIVSIISQNQSFLYVLLHYLLVKFGIKTCPQINQQQKTNCSPLPCFI